MIIIKDVTRCTLAEKLATQCNLSQTQVDLYLDIILDEIEGNSCILYDFEAINYCKKRIGEIEND